MKAFIYKITNKKTDDVYVGSTIQTLKNRFKAHKSNANVNKPGKLYECMRKIGIEHFKIELLEVLDTDHKSSIGEKEKEYYDLLKPSLNMKCPNIIKDRKIGRIYHLSYINDEEYFYIGSTMNEIDKRLSDHQSASNSGTTPLYKFMTDHGKDNFGIKCLEDNVPISELIIREEYWIKQMNPTLNKNTNLTMTEQERDRLKYIKNREKRLKQVSERRLLKRDEINAQKKEHYKKQCYQLNNAVIEPYKENPLFTCEILEKKNLLNLKIIARKFDIQSFPKLKKDLIQEIIQYQELKFGI
jgi:Uri superfamily endonuclease